MIKMNNKTIWIIVILVGILIFTQMEPKEIKKEAGETVSITGTDPIGLSQTFQLRFKLSSQAGVNLWKIQNVQTPTGWTYTYNKQSSGGSGSRNFICDESDPSGIGVSCSMIANLAVNGVVDDTLILEYTSPATTQPTTFSGNWETYSGGALQNSQSFTTSSVRYTQTCGSGNCAGTRIWDGSWGNCDTFGDDCGTCCSCSTTGIRMYSAVQDIDCSATTCPSDDCGVDTCGTNIFGDYPTSISNDCSALDTCQSNTCVGTATCSIDTDGDSYAGTFASFTLCYDCDEVGTYATMKNSGETEVCGSGVDENCDASSLMGNSEADIDCDSSTLWSELDGYITVWALATPWDKPLPPHTITWTLLDNVITIWALQ